MFSLNMQRLWFEFGYNFLSLYYKTLKSHIFWKQINVSHLNYLWACWWSSCDSMKLNCIVGEKRLITIIETKPDLIFRILLIIRTNCLCSYFSFCYQIAYLTVGQDSTYHLISLQQAMKCCVISTWRVSENEHNPDIW